MTLKAWSPLLPAGIEMIGSFSAEPPQRSAVPERSIAGYETLHLNIRRHPSPRTSKKLGAEYSLIILGGFEGLI